MRQLFHRQLVLQRWPLLLAALLFATPLAAITFVSAGGGKVVNASTLNFTLSVTANDTVCVGVNIINTANTVSSVTDTGGSVYSRKIAGGYFHDEIWCTPVHGALASTSVTVTLTGPAAAAASGADYAGVSGFGLSSSALGVTQTGGGLESITLTGIQAGSWVLAYFGDNAGVAAASSTGSLRNSQIDATYGEDGFLCDSTTPTCAVSTTVSTRWSAVALELQAGVSAPGNPGNFDVVAYGGAKCDGVTDDAAAIQKTNDDATAANFSLVTFPSRTCVSATGLTLSTSWSGVAGATIVKFTGATGPGFFLHGILLKNEGLTFVCSNIGASACFQVGGINSQLNRLRDLTIFCNNAAPNAGSIGLQFLTPASGANYFNTVESGWYISQCSTAIQTDPLANAQQVGLGTVSQGTHNGLLIQTTEGEYSVFCNSSPGPGAATVANSPTGATESGTTVTITTTAAHNFIVGDTVDVAGVGVSGYNGTFLIVTVPTTTTFTYTAGSGLAASGSGSATVLFACARLKPTPTSNVIHNIVTARAEPGVNSRTFEIEAANGGFAANNIVLAGDNSSNISRDLSGNATNLLIWKYGITSANGFVTPNNTAYQSYDSNAVLRNVLLLDNLGNLQLGSSTIPLTINNSTIRGTLFSGNQTTGCANGNFALSAGWGTTASVSAAAGFAQTCQVTITSSGTGQAANPTITDTLPATWPNATTVCTAQMVGGTGANTMIEQTTLSATAPIYTFNGTPVAASTYKVVFRCGP